LVSLLLNEGPLMAANSLLECLNPVRSIDLLSAGRDVPHAIVSASGCSVSLPALSAQPPRRRNADATHAR
jgi:hypothetical protein